MPIVETLLEVPLRMNIAYKQIKQQLYAFFKGGPLGHFAAPCRAWPRERMSASQESYIAPSLWSSDHSKSDSPITTVSPSCKCTQRGRQLSSERVG